MFEPIWIGMWVVAMLILAYVAFRKKPESKIHAAFILRIPADKAAEFREQLKKPCGFEYGNTVFWDEMRKMNASEMTKAWQGKLEFKVHQDAVRPIVEVRFLNR